MKLSLRRFRDRLKFITQKVDGKSRFVMDCCSGGCPCKNCCLIYWIDPTLCGSLIRFSDPVREGETNPPWQRLRCCNFGKSGMYRTRYKHTTVEIGRRIWPCYKTDPPPDPNNPDDFGGYADVYNDTESTKTSLKNFDGQYEICCEGKRKPHWKEQNFQFIYTRRDFAAESIYTDDQLPDGANTLESGICNVGRYIRRREQVLPPEIGNYEYYDRRVASCENIDPYWDVLGCGTCDFPAACGTTCELPPNPPSCCFLSPFAKPHDIDWVNPYRRIGVSFENPYSPDTPGLGLYVCGTRDAAWSGNIVTFDNRGTIGQYDQFGNFQSDASLRTTEWNMQPTDCYRGRYTIKYKTYEFSWMSQLRVRNVDPRYLDTSRYICNVYRESLHEGQYVISPEYSTSGKCTGQECRNYKETGSYCGTQDSQPRRSSVVFANESAQAPATAMDFL